MQCLRDIGFQKVGRWRLVNGKLTLDLHVQNAEKNILYAFVHAEVVLYIGKTTQTLSKRMAI